MKKLLILLLIVSAGQLFAQFKIGGDFRVRPRYDLIDNGDYGNTKNDFYYMYRARINMQFDIGDGWFFKSQLGHYGFGGYDFTSGLSQSVQIPVAIEGAKRPNVNFMQLYYGVKKDTWGIIGGIIPVNGFGNPLYDVHYYPYRMVDVPFTLFSIGAAFGFEAHVKLGDGTLNVQLLADKNEYLEEEANGTTLNDKNDSYTVAASYTVKAADFTIQPMAMFAFASEGNMAPFTYGINLTSPKFGKFTLGASLVMSTQDNEGTEGLLEYDASLIRVKVTGALNEKFSLLAFYDIAKRTDKFGAVEVENDYSYLWFMLNYTVYSGDKGKVVISPTVRLISQETENAVDFSRQKLEVSTTINF